MSQLGNLASNNFPKLVLLAVVIAVPISLSLSLYSTVSWHARPEVQRQADSVPYEDSLFPSPPAQPSLAEPGSDVLKSPSTTFPRARPSLSRPSLEAPRDAPKSPSTTPAALVRSQLIEAVLGLVVFNPPTEMTVGVPEQITVRISRGIAETTVKAKLQGRGVPQVEEIKVGTFMRARLYGHGFEVSSKSDEGQVVPDNGFAEWLYDVTPLEAGTKSITLQISLRYKLPGSEEITNLPVMTRQISVQVNHWWTAKSFMADNWQWFLGGFGSLMMAVGGFFGKRLLEARDGKTPKHA